MITVGEFREATKHLPDSAPICLQVLNEPEPFVEVHFYSISVDTEPEPHAVINGEILQEGDAGYGTDPEPDDDEDDEQDPEAVIDTCVHGIPVDCNCAPCRRFTGKYADAGT